MRRRRGFTLIEVLVTTALAALVMVAVLEVVRSTGRLRAAMDRTAHTEPWADQVLDRIEQDLLQSDLVTTSKTSVVMTGYSSMNTDSTDRTHRPVRVRYLIEDGEGDVAGVLIREQQWLDVESSASITRALCGCRISALQVASVTDSTGGSNSVQYRIAIQVNDRSERVFDRTVILH